MPQIPVYNSQRNINANPVAPMRQEAERPYQDFQKVVGVVQDITQKWSDAHDIMQATESEAKYNVGIINLQSMADADPDFLNSEKYKKELAKVKNESLKGVQNASVRSNLAMKFDYSNQIAAIKIDAQFQQKQIAYNEVQFSDYVETQLSKRLTSSPEEQKKIDRELEINYTNQVSYGLISREKADKIIEDARKTSVQYAIYADTATEEKDSSVLKDLQNPNSELSKTVDPKTRLSLIKESQDRIYQNNQTMKRATKAESETRTNSLITDVAKRTADLSRIDKEFSIPEEQGGVNRETLRNLKKVVIQGNTDTLNKIVRSDDNAASYYNAFDKILEEDDRSKAKELIVKAWADKNLSLEEGEYLDKVYAQTGEAPKFALAVRSIWRKIRGYKGSSDREAALSLHELVNRSINGMSPEDAADQIIYEDIMKRNPELVDMPEGTEVLAIDHTGAIKMIKKNKGKIEVTEPKGKQ